MYQKCKSDFVNIVTIRYLVQKQITSVKFHKCNPAITQIDIQGILGDGRLSLQALDFMPDKAKVVVSYLGFFVPISSFSTLICLKFCTDCSKIWLQNLEIRRRNKSYKNIKATSIKSLPKKCTNDCPNI